MAVLGKITCTVEVDKRAVREYNDPDRSKRQHQQILKYIEVCTGKEFFPHVTFRDDFIPKHNAVVVDVYMDGEYYNSRVLYTDPYQQQLQWKEVIIKMALNVLPPTDADGEHRSSSRRLQVTHSPEILIFQHASNSFVAFSV